MALFYIGLREVSSSVDEIVAYSPAAPTTSTTTPVPTTLPPPPIVDFSADPVYGASILSVQFTDLSTGSPDEWDWDFGDGSPNSSEENPSHDYIRTGFYTITLTASNAGGSNSMTKTAYVNVVSAPEPVLESSECTEPALIRKNFWDYISTFWNYLLDDDRSKFENFWYALQIAGNEMTKKANRFFDIIDPQRAHTCVLDDYYDIKMGYLHSKPIDLDPTKKTPTSTILPIGISIVYDADLEPTDRYNIELNYRDYYAIRNVAGREADGNAAQVVIIPKRTEIGTKVFPIYDLLSSDEVNPSDRYYNPESASKPKYMLQITGDLSYLLLEKFSLYLTTGKVYNIDPAILSLPTLQNFIENEEGGNSLTNGVDYIFDNHMVEFIEDPIKSNVVKSEEYLYCPKSLSAENFLYELYGNMVGIPDWIQYNTGNISGKAAISGLMLALQNASDRIKYELALNIYYGLPIAPEKCSVFGLYESYGYEIIEKVGNTLTLDIPPTISLHNFFQIGGSVLCPEKGEVIITGVVRDLGKIYVHDAANLVVGDHIHIKLTNRYRIISVIAEPVDGNAQVIIDSPNGSGAIQHLVSTVYELSGGKEYPELVIYGTDKAQNNYDGLYHITSASGLIGEPVVLTLYKKPEGEDALYNDSITLSTTEISHGFAHVPWPTHKFLYLRLDSDRYFRAYLDSTIDTILEANDSMEMYDVIARNVAAINDSILPRWNEFDQLKRATGINVNSDIVEITHLVPSGRFASFFPESIVSPDTEFDGNPDPEPVLPTTTPGPTTPAPTTAAPTTPAPTTPAPTTAAPTTSAPTTAAPTTAAPTTAAPTTSPAPTTSTTPAPTTSAPPP